VKAPPTVTIRREWSRSPDARAVWRMRLCARGSEMVWKRARVVPWGKRRCALVCMVEARARRVNAASAECSGMPVARP